jgi:uncharacterized membrane protein YhhN
MGTREGAWNVVVMELTWYAPILLVLGVGIFAALWRWQRHRRVSILAIVGVLLFLSGVASSLWLSWTITSGEEWDGWDMGLGEDARRVRITQILVSGLQALGLACLIAAIFIDRRTPAASRRAVE